MPDDIKRFQDVKQECVGLGLFGWLIIVSPPVTETVTRVVKTNTMKRELVT